MVDNNPFKNTRMLITKELNRSMELATEQELHNLIHAKPANPIEGLIFDAAVDELRVRKSRTAHDICWQIEEFLSSFNDDYVTDVIESFKDDLKEITNLF